MQLDWRRLLLCRMKKIFCLLSMRQGTIMIAIHQIVLAASLLALFMVGMAHAGDVMHLLRTDMADDASREGLITFTDHNLDNHAGSHDGEMTSNNHEKFIRAEKLAKGTIIILYTIIIITALYLLFCCSLLYGAIKRKKEYIEPWILMSGKLFIAIIVVMYLAEEAPIVIKMCTGKYSYMLFCSLYLASHYYNLIAVASYWYELRSPPESTQCLHNECSGEKCDGAILKEEKKKDGDTGTAIIVSHHV